MCVVCLNITRSMRRPLQPSALQRWGCALCPSLAGHFFVLFVLFALSGFAGLLSLLAFVSAERSAAYGIAPLRVFPDADTQPFAGFAGLLSLQAFCGTLPSRPFAGLVRPCRPFAWRFALAGSCGTCLPLLAFCVAFRPRRLLPDLFALAARPLFSGLFAAYHPRRR